MYKKRGLLIVLSGPSGVGKGTVRKELFTQPDTNYEYSISMTTRSPREGEVDGSDYFFKSRDEFEQLLEEGKLLEYAEYVGNYYGTPLDYVNERWMREEMSSLKLKWSELHKCVPKFQTVYSFSLHRQVCRNLKIDLIGRGTEEADVIASRIAKAREELEMMNLYDYVVENDEVSNACDRINAIVTAEHCRRERVEKSYLAMLEGE